MSGVWPARCRQRWESPRRQWAQQWLLVHIPESRLSCRKSSHPHLLHPLLCPQVVWGEQRKPSGGWERRRLPTRPCIPGWAMWRDLSAALPGPPALAVHSPHMHSGLPNFPGWDGPAGSGGGGLARPLSLEGPLQSRYHLKRLLSKL